MRGDRLFDINRILLQVETEGRLFQKNTTQDSFCGSNSSVSPTSWARFVGLVVSLFEENGMINGFLIGTGSTMTSM